MFGWLKQIFSKENMVSKETRNKLRQEAISTYNRIAFDELSDLAGVDNDYEREDQKEQEADG